MVHFGIQVVPHFTNKQKIYLLFGLIFILGIVDTCVTCNNTEDTKASKDMKAGGDTSCYLRVRKDPEWYQTMSSLGISDPSIRVSVRAVTREEDPSEYTHLIVSLFHSPGMSSWDPELKKLPNLTSISALVRLDKNCDIVSNEKIIDEFGAEEDDLRKRLNMRPVRIPNLVW